MIGRSAVLFSLIGLMSACGASQSAQVSDSEGTESQNSEVREDSAPKESPVTTVAPAAGPSATISYMAFGEGGLHVGTRDGWLGTFQIMNRSTSAHQMSNSGVSVAAASADGGLALLASDPPQVVNKEGALILNLNTVSDMESGIFARDSFSLFVSETSGRVRVWGQAHSFEVPKGDEKLENYLNKQASDFNVTFAPLSGPLYLMPGGSMVFGDKEGVISIWNPAKPSQSSRIMKLNGPVKSLSGSGNEVVATSVGGQLKAGRLDPPSFYGWARDAKGDYAATADLLRGKFIESSDGVIRLRVTETGETEWEVPAKGKPCGVAVSPDGNFAAVCLDHKVAILQVSNGAWDSTVWIDKGKLHFAEN